MANELALVTAGALRIVGIPQEQFTIPGEEAITAGQAVRLNPSTGKLTKSNGTDTTEDRVFGIASRTPENYALGITVIRQGVLDGFDLSALDYGVDVYLSDTDGAISGTTGTTGRTVGKVIPGFAAGLNSADKVLLVNLNKGEKGEKGDTGASGSG